MSQTAALVAERFEAWGFVPHVVREVFPDASPAGVAAALDELCVRELGSGIERSELFEASVGSVHGLRLRDGRRVVVKAHRPGTSSRFLDAVQTVQRRLLAHGFPAPAPLAGPTPLGRGTATVESLLDRGEHADAHDPDVRRATAASLARFVTLCRPLAGLPGLRDCTMEIDPERLWPLPHSGRHDFEATARGAEWLDRIAARARRLRDRPVGELVLGHADWRVQHLRFADGELAAVYDWDALRVAREPLLVGTVAHGFTADWSVEGRRQFPSLEEARAFIADYEAARGAPFGAEERAVLTGSLAYAFAYTARCEHSDALTDMGRRAPRAPAPGPFPAGRARAFLAEHAAVLLGADPAEAPAPVR